MFDQSLPLTPLWNSTLSQASQWRWALSGSGYQHEARSAPYVVVPDFRGQMLRDVQEALQPTGSP